MGPDLGVRDLEDWALRALERWPHVPGLFGWLGLDRRGRWTIRGEIISRPQIIETINRNYEADAYGRWFFQNGPQRGYVNLETAPLIAYTQDNRLMTHTQLEINAPTRAYLDEEGSLMLATEHGPAALMDSDLEWALSRMTCDGEAVRDDHVFSALAIANAHATTLALNLTSASVPIWRLDRELAPSALGFVRNPTPREGEAFSVREND
ncbi:MAG: DUF2946 family protein [Povalibacter sp.]